MVCLLPCQPHLVLSVTSAWLIRLGESPIQTMCEDVRSTRSLRQRRVRNLLPGYSAGSRCNYMTRGVNQFIMVIAAEVVAGRVQRSRNGDNFLGVERCIVIHEEADELD